MEATEGVTEAKGGVPEPEVGNMEAEEGVTEADGGVMEADLKRLRKLKEGLRNLILKRLRTMKEGLRKLKKLPERWSVWLDIIFSINYEAS
ncbi:hypothetical protein R1flu_010840 [Riccia fluitans]|uniref:Uncharacterized protein n=1 Tax=Riccia fluitans TaxID=41844 RepID=A0ABD1Z686_9MARC